MTIVEKDDVKKGVLYYQESERLDPYLSYKHKAKNYNKFLLNLKIKSEETNTFEKQQNEDKLQLHITKNLISHSD